MSKEKVKTFTGSGTFNIAEEMVKDSKDLLDSVEVTTIAAECQKLKEKEDEIAKQKINLKLKSKRRMILVLGLYQNY